MGQPPNTGGGACWRWPLMDSTLAIFRWSGRFQTFFGVQFLEGCKSTVLFCTKVIRNPCGILFNEVSTFTPGGMLRLL
jgi:hypothetical protein